MKNKHEQLKIQQAKTYHQNKTWRLNDGYYIPHFYPVEDIDQLSYWDDVGFIFGKKRVMVHWQHPRSVYADKCHSLAWDEFYEEFSAKQNRNPKKAIKSFLGDSIKNYKKVGKSRKKIHSYTMNGIDSDHAEFYNKVNKSEKDYCETGIDFEVKSSFKRTQTDWSLIVDIVYPMEIRSDKDAIKLAEFVKSILKNKSLLEDYSYGKNEWLQDNKKTKEEKFSSHILKE